MNVYTKYFDDNSEYMNLLVFDKELFKKDNEIWDKVEDLFLKKV